MPNFDDSHVKLNGGIVVWDSVTRPEIQDQGKNAGKPKWSLKVVFEPNNPDIALYNDLANRTLQASEFKGVLPQGGRMPVLTCGPNEYGGQFNGWPAISFKTTLRCPDVYDDNGQLLDPMQYGQLVYGGQRVDVLAHCYPINAGGNRGISAGLDGFALILSANAQRMDFGGNGMDTSAAFGAGGGQQQQGGYQNNPQQPQQQNNGYQQQPNQNGGGYQDPNQGNPNNQNQNGGGYQDPNQGNPNNQDPNQHASGNTAQQNPTYAPQGGQQQPNQNQNGGNQPMQQAHNYLPQ